MRPEEVGPAAISRERVREEYEKAALTVSRIRSEELDDDYYADDDTLAYYEGRRDALRALLEPQEVEASG